MSEQVTRHRGGGRNGDGQWTPGSDAPLTPLEVAPGGGAPYAERAREGETAAFTVYFAPGTDITTEDELTVRGKRFGIVVNDWGVGGVEVLCTRGQG